MAEGGSSLKTEAGDTSDDEIKTLNKKLQTFLEEMLIFGAVKGFKYFVTYIRGKEEIILSVYNSPMTMPIETHYPELEVLKQAYEEKVHAASTTSFADSWDFPSRTLPYDKRTLMLSLRTQRQLSGAENDHAGDVPLPPASPSEHETVQSGDQSTMFLLAGYSRYMAPYVWIRSNHDRLISLSKEEHQGKDWPLNLRTTNAWRQRLISPWQIVAEVIKLSTAPSPLNPFEIDIEYFNSLPPASALYATAAMIDLLGRIISPSPEKLVYASKSSDRINISHHFQPPLHWKETNNMSDISGQVVRMNSIRISGVRVNVSSQNITAFGTYGPQDKP